MSPPARSQLRDRLGAYWQLTRMHRPIGIFLLLWPTLWALWIAAEGVPDPYILSVFLLGTVLMRAAGCVINDFADRDFDGRVARTRERPLATGRVGSKEALGVFVGLVLSAGLLVLTLDRLTVALAFVAVGLAVLYPFMKRYTYIPQVYLGAAFGWSVPMAFAAQTRELPPTAWLIFCAVVLWVLIYDTEYAMVDRDDDRRIGIKSTAILFDDADRLIIALLQVLLLCDLLLIGNRAQLGSPYYMALVIAGALAVYQQHLIHERRPADCFKAFLSNNWYGAVVFAGVALSYYRATA